MMQTDDLIAHLSADVAPVRPGAVARLLFAGIAAGLVLAIVVMLAALGPRPDMASAVMQFHFWMKFFYTGCLALLGLWLVERTGRPGAPTRRPLLLLLLPVTAIFLLAGLAMSAPGANHHTLMMGRSALVCPWLIVMIALPLLGSGVWVLRRLAPPNLPLAGAAAGLFAGAAGAFVYAFHCTESAAPFVAIWYSLGILLCAALGASLGRWVLRW